MLRITTTLLTVLLAAGCGILGADEERVVGRIDLQGFEVDDVVTVPDTVELGVPFGVEVLTSSGGCGRPGSTEAAVDGRVATIVPYDFEKTGGNCAALQVLFEHAAEVAFQVLGDAEVRIVGRDMSGEALEITRPVWVR